MSPTYMMTGYAQTELNVTDHRFEFMILRLFFEIVFLLVQCLIQGALNVGNAIYGFR